MNSSEKTIPILTAETINDIPKKKENQYLNQTITMIKKILLIFIRNPKTLIAIFSTPFAICLILTFLQILYSSYTERWEKKNPSILELGMIPKCFKPENCTTIQAVILDNSIKEKETNYNTVKHIMNYVAKENELKMGSDVVIQYFNSYLDYSLYIENNLNQTYFSIIFCYDNLDVNEVNLTLPCRPEYNDGSNDFFFYTIVYNISNTPNDFLVGTDIAGMKDENLMKLKMDIDNGLIEVLDKKYNNNNGDSPKIKMSYSDYPMGKLRTMKDASVVNNIGCPFFFFIPMILFALVLIEITREKQLKLRTSLVIIGLKTSSFWIGWICIIFLFSLSLSFIFISFTMILQWDVFINTPFPIIFTLFFLFIFSLQCFALFLSTLLPSVNASYTTSFAVILFGFVIQSVFSYQTVYYMMYSDLWIVVIFRYFLYLFSPFHFTKAFLDISTIAGNKLDLGKLVNTPGKPYHYSDLLIGEEGTIKFIFVDYSIPPTYFFFIFMLIDSIIYIILALYFDNVITSNRGKANSIFFPILKIIKLFKCSKFGASNRKKKKLQENLLVESNNENNGKDIDEGNGLEICEISKEYKLNNKTILHALKPFSMTIPKGRLMALLGHNGAGKTTLINILSGKMFPTSGYAKVNNQVIVLPNDEVPSVNIKNMIGLCPQHDILWEELTPYEHIEIYAKVRGILKERIDDLAIAKLKEVNLIDYMNEPVRTFSGGMKRRISILLATIGNPEVLFLDEPTTGLDPVNRRFIWEMIRKIKEHRTVILTTHSMDEAEYLSDKISIIYKGELVCEGTPIELKKKYGSGYYVNFVCKEGSSKQVIDELKTLIPKAKMISNHNETLQYQIDYEDIDGLNMCVQILNKNQKLSIINSLIKESGINEASLEDVFRKVYKQSEIEKEVDLQGVN